MWTSERIRTELSAFCDELGGWPRASEFKEAGRGDLYLAASRYGGIDHWADELGSYEDEVPEPSEPESGSGESELRRWVPLAGTGLATLAALAFLSVVFIGSNRLASERAWPRPPLKQGHDATARPVAERGGAPDRPGVLLRLVAASGDSSLVGAVAGSADGRLLWEGILERGESVRFRGRLWLSLGAPGNLVARLNGDRAALPRRTSTARVTASGIRCSSASRSPRSSRPPTPGVPSRHRKLRARERRRLRARRRPRRHPTRRPARARAPRPIHPQEIEHGEDMGIRRPSRRRGPDPARSGGWPGDLGSAPPFINVHVSGALGSNGWHIARHHSRLELRPYRRDQDIGRLRHTNGRSGDHGDSLHLHRDEQRRIRRSRAHMS